LSHRFTPLQAALPLLTTALLLFGMVATGKTDFYFPVTAGLLVAALLAWRAGSPVSSLLRWGRDGVKSTLIALSILVLVGALIGVWKASGTVPAMVYYGLQLASPAYLVPAAFLLAAVVSMMLGTFVGTLSTLGVAIMGMAHGIGAPLPLVAGALVSGALIGDRGSPLSGSLHLNVAMTGTDVRRMQTVLLPTGILAAVISLLGYVWMGSGMPVNGGGMDTSLRGAIASHFIITPWLLLPSVLVLTLAFLRVPVRWALGLGMLASATLGVLFGGVEWLDPVKAAIFGYSAQVSDLNLSRIFGGGGIVPMGKQFALIIAAGALSGIMEATGMMRLVFARLTDGTRRPLALVGSTMTLAVVVALVAANQALPLIVTGRMFRDSYDRSGVPAEVLSRTLADSSTVLVGVIPWNLMAVIATATLGVPARSFLPYAFFALSLPLVSLAYTALEERRRSVSIVVE